MLDILYFLLEMQQIISVLHCLYHTLPHLLLEFLIFYTIKRLSTIVTAQTRKLGISKGLLQ